MARDPSVYLVCYDIADPARLRMVHRIMRGYGDAIQKSVFRCELSDRQHALMAGRLMEAVKHDEDQVLILRTGPVASDRSWQVQTIGLPVVYPDQVVLVY
jgi:CRISPR-associated protein Cas2